jgi:HEAT repeats
MRYNHYQTVAQLTEAQQRVLLQTGDAVERVWAVWALALRDGSSLLPELNQWMHAEPDPGTRRHMVVLLAGTRAYDHLATLAAIDPDHDVRASACQYLARICGRTDPDIRTLLRRRLLTDQSTVRAAIISELPELLEEISEAEIEHLTIDPDRDVRMRIMEKMVDQLGHESAILRLTAWLLREPDRTIRQRLLRAGLQSPYAATLTAAIAQQPLEHVRELLEPLSTHPPQLSWSIITPLCALGQPDLDAVLVTCAKPEPAAVNWLLACLLRAAQNSDYHTSRDALLSQIWRAGSGAEQLLIQLDLTRAAVLLTTAARATGQPARRL